MHSFYDNDAAYAIIIIIKEQNPHVSLQCSTSKKRTNNARFKEIHSTVPAKTQLSYCACPYNKNVAVLMTKKNENSI